MFLAESVLMIEPVGFKMNHQTALDNKFQSTELPGDRPADAIREFVNFRDLLRNHDIDVVVFHPGDEKTPDSVFPNNWFSTDPRGQLYLYPMKAENRRMERRTEFIHALQQTYSPTFDLSFLENENEFLEGTGSLILDHEKKLAFASLSSRTTKVALRLWQEQTNYEIIPFHSFDKNGDPIYHTNVIMTLCDGFAIVCTEAITDSLERNYVMAKLKSNYNEVIEITIDQLHRFCGNCLQLKNKSGEKFLIMSTTAFHGFTPFQRERMMHFTTILHADISCIERAGGGSARRMLAELF